MKHMLAVLALAASVVASPYPQAVTSAIAPESPAPEGCQTSHDGSFQITVVNVSSSATKRDMSRRQLDGPLTIDLADSVLTDQAGRTGYIAANCKEIASSVLSGRYNVSNMLQTSSSSTHLLRLVPSLHRASLYVPTTPWPWVALPSFTSV
jgi:hypothetical protein